MRFPFFRAAAQELPAAPPSTPRLVLGLGNPGPEYARHRHNVGFQCIDALAKQLGACFDEGHRVARLAEATVDSTSVVLAKPKTFVNRSGEAAAALLQRYRLAPADLIVVYDELDLPLGRIRIRAQGSSGGHNGLKSIIQHVRSQDFPRVRVGIGRPPRWDEAGGVDDRSEAVIRWVLSGFTPQEEELMAATRQRVTEAVLSILTEGVVAAMNRFNNDKTFV